MDMTEGRSMRPVTGLTSQRNTNHDQPRRGIRSILLTLTDWQEIQTCIWHSSTFSYHHV
jgi:hypothetical protein